MGMPSGPLSMIATALTGVNMLLLLGLAVVWFRNYRTFNSPLLLGLVAFAGVMFVENAIAVYFYFSSSMLFATGAPFVEQAVAAMRILQFVALVFLTWVTMQ
jgi:hypothetical protein